MPTTIMIKGAWCFLTSSGVDLPEILLTISGILESNLGEGNDRVVWGLDLFPCNCGNNTIRPVWASAGQHCGAVWLKPEEVKSFVLGKFIFNPSNYHLFCKTTSNYYFQYVHNIRNRHFMLL